MSFEALYLEHAPFVRRALARRGVPTADLDDVLQEAFVTIHRLLPTFEGRASVETWLHSVTWRVAASYHRRTRGRVEVAVEASDAAAPALGVAPHNLHASLAGIDEEQRDLFALHEIGGLSISQLAEMTGSARATIRLRVERARVALGKRIWKMLTEPDDAAWLERLAPRVAARIAGAPHVPVREAWFSHTAITTYEDIVIALWRGPSTIPALEALTHVMLTASEANAAGFRYISIVESTSTAPAREGRQLMGWMAGTLGNRFIAAGWAVESPMLTPFVASVVNTSCFLGGVPLNLRFFDAVPAATEWVAQYGTTAAEDLAAQIEAMRRRLPPAVSSASEKKSSTSGFERH